MTALKSSDVDAFIARPDPRRPVVLVYGPDAGLVRERVEALVRAAVDDPRDPFSFVQLEGDLLASEPSRIVEEAHTISLFGRRAVLVKAGTKNFLPAVEALLAAPPVDCRVVIEAGELRRNAPLRLLCERAKNAAALPCYADDERALARLIDEELRAASLSITPDARAALMASIGGDRLASRGEIRKLALYAHGKRQIMLEDVAAVIADAAALAADSIADAAFAGEVAEVDEQYAKARSAGAAPGAIAGGALRQAIDLHRARLRLDAGAGVEEALGHFRPPVHFTRRPRIEAALRKWTAARLEQAMLDLARAAFEARARPALADAIAERALLMVAQSARRKG
jgi:DNA polymerase-3 subunit delta